MKLKVYIAAPYEDAKNVRALSQYIVPLFKGELEITSSWATVVPDGKEDFNRLTLEQHRQQGENNDTDILGSHVMLVMARDGVGGEMFAEARFASIMHIPIFWCGRVINTAFRKGIRRFKDISEINVLHYIEDKVIQDLLNLKEDPNLPNAYQQFLITDKETGNTYTADRFMKDRILDLMETEPT